MRREKAWVKLLGLTNMVSLIFLAIVSLHYKVPQKVLIKMGIIRATNSHYDVRNRLFSAYNTKEYRIVMLGDSITEGAAWNELLGIGINEIANRGIGGDITEGFYKRLETIYPLKPEMCFIMGGINDIGRGIPVENILENMEKITEALEWNGIKPIIQSTLYVSKARENWEKVNRKVDAVNKGLKEIGIKRGIPFVDINGIVSAKDALKDEYTYDGIHLDGAGYKAWGKEIGNIIKNE